MPLRQRRKGARERSDSGGCSRGEDRRQPLPFLRCKRGRIERSETQGVLGEGQGRRRLKRPRGHLILPINKSTLVPTSTTMLASDILPPRSASSRGMKRMLDRLQPTPPASIVSTSLPPDTTTSSRREPGSRGDGPGDEVQGPSFKSHKSQFRLVPWLPDSASKSPTGLAFLYTKTPDTDWSNPN